MLSALGGHSKTGLVLSLGQGLGQEQAQGQLGLQSPKTQSLDPKMTVMRNLSLLMHSLAVPLTCTWTYLPCFYHPGPTCLLQHGTDSHVRACARACIYAKDRRQSWKLFLRCHPPCFMRQDLSLNLKLSD